MVEMAAYGPLDFWPFKRKEASSLRFPIDNRKKELSTKLWYSAISHLATCFKRYKRAYDFDCSIEKRRDNLEHT